MMNGFELIANTYRIEKDPDDVLSYGMQWYEFLRGSDKYWEPRTFVRPGEIRTPSQDALNAHRYVAINGGKTGITEPVWPTVAIETVVDGGVTWKENGFEDTILTASWDAGGLTSTNEQVDVTGCVTQATLSGLAAGQEYIVRNRIASVQGKQKDQSFTVVVREN